jgi:hypothetical protein
MTSDASTRRDAAPDQAATTGAATTEAATAGVAPDRAAGTGATTAEAEAAATGGGGQPGRAAQLACTWGGPVTLVGALAGWLLAGVLPVPPAASYSTAQTVAWYAGNPTAVRAGLLLATIAVCGIGPLIAVISIQMLRIEGRRPLLSLLQLLSGAVTWVMLFLPMIIMNVAAFRPDRNPELTVTLTDLAWLLFITPIGPFIVQNLAIAAAVFTDRSARPVFPRWLGYANVWIAVLFCPAGLAYFFKSGPFAWQGLFAFWFGLFFYSVWIVLMFVTVRRAVRAEYGPAA